MQLDINIGELVLHALTAVGILEWIKKVIEIRKHWYAWILPGVAVGVGLSTLYTPVMIGLRVLAIAQLAYPLLVQLPKRVIDGTSGAQDQ